MVLSRCFGSLAIFLSGAEAARKRRTSAAAPQTKFIAGVPVFEYHAAYGGTAALGELESDPEGEWIMLLQPGTSDAQVQNLCDMNKNGCNLVGHPGGGVPFLELKGTEADLEQVIHGAGGVVQFITPDQEDFLIPEIGDVGVLAATDGGLNLQASNWGLNRIAADSRGRTGAGATIYVLDTGIRVTHQQFGGRAASALDLTSGRPVQCNGDVRCAGDRRGHGTHCAGIAAGATFGVAPGAAVRAVKTVSDQGSGPRSWQYKAIDWVTERGVRPAVISMSVGGSGFDPGYTPVINAAVNNGVIVVVAGGNSNSDACNSSPAFATRAITVGSTTSLDKRSSSSNYGACTDIWAPGSNILSAGISTDRATNTYSGTDMACPHVAGAAALLLSADPTKKASAVLEELLDNAAMNIITDLRKEDTNALLYVGAGGAPPSPTVPPPTRSTRNNCNSWCRDTYPNSCGYTDCRNNCAFC